MTRAERRYEAAKKREREAAAKASAAYERRVAAIAAAHKKCSPAYWKAERARTAARAELTVAELALYGIEAGKTIIECTPFMARRIGRFVVTVKASGWPSLQPVGVSGKVLAGRRDQQTPTKWTHVRIIGEVAP